MSDPPPDPLSLWGVDRPSRKRPDPSTPTPPRPAADLPQPSVMPATIEVESPARTASVPLLIVNRGGGRLAADLVGNAHWLRVSHPFITDNRVRVEVELNLGALEDDKPAKAQLTLRSGRIAIDIPVHACRFTLRRSLEQYRKGDLSLVKDSCRRILEVDPNHTAAAVLLASAWLEERNFPSALKALQELPPHSEAPEHASVELPDTIPEKILDSLAEHPGALRGLEHGIPIYERLEPLVPPRVRPKLDAVMRQAYVDWFKDRLEERRTSDREDGETESDPSYLLLRAEPRGGDADVRPSPNRLGPLPPEDIDRLDARARRLAERFPDDPVWPRLSTVLANELKGRARQRKTRRTTLVALAAVLVAVLVGGFFLVQALRLRAARDTLARAAYADTVRNATEFLDWNPDHAEARLLRGNANLRWAQALFDQGNAAAGGEKLEQAEADLRGDAAFEESREKLYRKWADDLLSRGRFDEALERYVALAQLGGENKILARRIESLRPTNDLYRLLGKLNQETGPVDLARAGDWGPRLAAAGLEPFAGRIQLMLVDLRGDGTEDIMMAGSGVRVWRPQGEELPDGAVGVRFEKLKEASAAPDKWLLGLRLQRLTTPGEATPATPGHTGGKDVPVVQVDWLRTEGALIGHSTFFWAEGAAVHSWTPPDSPYPAEVLDRDGDGRREIWANRMVGDQRTPDTAAAVPIPYDWRNGRPVEATLRFSDYYLDEVIPDLERAAASPPFREGDPRRARFQANARAAIQVARTLAQR